MKRFLISVFALVSSSAYGQWVAEAPLPTITKSGFYKVPLSPAVTSLMTDNFANLRVLDENGKEVPYVNDVELTEDLETKFVTYEMEKETRKGCCTMLTFKNTWKPINDVVLTMRNANVTKDATLLGSDDKENWYVIREKFRLTNHGGYTNSVTVDANLDFPLSKYDYYRVTINDSTAAPLNIISAGYYEHIITHGSLTELPSVKFVSSDSADNSTWTAIRFDTTQFVTRMEFDVSGPALYKRSATLFTKTIIRTKKTTRDFYQPVANFFITSRTPAVAIMGIKVSELYLQVLNENNPPLQIKAIKALQSTRSVITWLEPGHNYKIALGSDSLQFPRYDLLFFQDSIPSNPEQLTAGEVKPLIRPAQASTTPTFFTNRNIIWVAIIIVVAILGTMSVRMLRDNDKQRDSH